MRIWILMMWLHGNAPAPLIIDAYDSQAKCEVERPKYDTSFSFGDCSFLEVK